jgi:hypothetical protein
LNQRELAEYIALKSNAHYHFIAKGNRKTLLKEVASFFENFSWDPDYANKDKPNLGRNESSRIWVTTGLNACLKFPHVDEVFKIERVNLPEKKKKYTSCRIRNHQ